jgi:hypothetical protein
MQRQIVRACADCASANATTTPIHARPIEAMPP